MVAVVVVVVVEVAAAMAMAVVQEVAAGAAGLWSFGWHSSRSPSGLYSLISSTNLRPDHKPVSRSVCRSVSRSVGRPPRPIQSPKSNTVRSPGELAASLSAVFGPPFPQRHVWDIRGAGKLSGQTAEPTFRNFHLRST